MAGVGVGDRGNVGYHQLADALGRLLGQLHGDLAPHGVAHNRHLVQTELVQQSEHGGRLQGVAHLV
ncbi:hypothetical protein D3C78_1976050 [compost metagenome]